ncbi:metallophosphoesterase family protein [Xanthobacter autotrophicus DSM 431]|uniref:metallophosphoesterase family protein n=1 Tax=Xanthobacter nonsaccharivorans TaxID=3119912 RepID=UPI003729C52F
MTLLKPRPPVFDDVLHEPVAPVVPENMRVYAIGDVHGRLDLLTTLQEHIDEDMGTNPGPNCIEVYLGDYVDRGAQSAGVIDALRERMRKRRVVCLSGNHESMMLDAFVSQDAFPHWLRVGGLETVFSYITPTPGLDEAQMWKSWREAVPPAHVAFLQQLHSHFVCGNYAFVHAGLRPGVPLELQRREDMMWIRREFLDCPDWFGHCVVHGHTPIREAEVLSNRINIDTGAYATGHLTCLILEGADRYLIAT